jgi:hypothetical protein
MRCQRKLESARNGLTGLAVTLVVSPRFLPGHKHRHIRHLAGLTLSNLVRTKLFQLGLEALLLLGRQFRHVHCVLLVVGLREGRSSVVPCCLVKRGSSGLQVTLGRGIFSRCGTGDRISPLHRRHLLGRRSPRRTRRRLVLLGKILLIRVLLHDITRPSDHQLLMRRTETPHPGNHGGMSSSAGEFPGKILCNPTDRVRFLEFRDSRRGEDTGCGARE